jgi:hypothetical protein
MNHEVTILYKPEYLARPWGCVCAECGAFAACVTEEEAKESRESHLERHRNDSRSPAAATE